MGPLRHFLQTGEDKDDQGFGVSFQRSDSMPESESESASSVAPRADIPSGRWARTSLFDVARARVEYLRGSGYPQREYLASTPLFYSQYYCPCHIGS